MMDAGIGGMMSEVRSLWWFAMLVEAALKGALVLLAVAALAAALRRAPAAVRHQVWAVAVGSLLALPLLVALLPSWKVPLIPNELAAVMGRGPRVPQGRLAEPSPSESLLPSPESSTGAGRPVTATNQDASTAPAAGTGRPSDSPASRGTAGTETSLASGGGPASVDSTARRLSTLPGWPVLLLGAWLAVAVVLVGRLAVAVLAATWITWRARPVSEPTWNELARDQARRLGLRRPFRLLESCHTRMPMAWGIVRPTILLPRNTAGWDGERRRVVLLHELAHIRRRDCPVQLVAHLAAAFHWFNPLVWLAARRLQSERERACDDLVLAAGTPRTAYARHLLEIARSMGGGPQMAWATVSMARPSQLEGRLLAILDPEREGRVPSRLASLLVPAMLGSLVLPLAALQPWAKALEPGVEREDTRRGTQRYAETRTLMAVGQHTGPRTRIETDGQRRDRQEAVIAALARRLAGAHHMGVHGPAAIDAIGSPTGLGTADVDLGGPVLEALAGPMLGGAVEPMLVGGALAEAVHGALGRQQVAETGGALDERIFEAMLRALSDSNPEIREQAASSLGTIESERAVQALGSALRDDDSPRVRRRAAWALGMIESAEGIAALTAALGDADAGVREQAAWALGMIEDPQAVTVLTGALDDAEEDVREQAAWALGMIEDPSAVEPLGRALDDDSPAIREKVVWALGMIEDATAVEALVRVLRGDASPRVRKQAAWALGMIEDESAAEALIDALEDDDTEVRKTAMWALTQVIGELPEEELR